jgi:nucleoside-diphosphate-sugar epimerase
MTGARVLVTGGTGFVGRHVLRALAARGVPVRAVIRTGSASRLPEVLGDIDIRESADLFSETAGWWEAACEGIGRIVHLAWIATPGTYLTAPENLDCLQGTLALAKGGARAGVSKILGVGTCFEYDLSGGVLPAETPLRPATPYAAAKAAAFLALSQWLPSQRVAFLWARLFYLYGEGEDSRRLVPYLHKQLAAGVRAELTSGRQIRDYLDVHEAAEQLVDALYSDMEGAFNLCSGVPVTVRQLAERIADEYGRRDLLGFGARADNFVDPPCVLGLPGQARQLDPPPASVPKTNQTS